MFAPGTKVECIQEHNGPPWFQGGKLGARYTVRDSGITYVHQRGYILLVEITNPINPDYGCEFRLSATRFRPIVERKTDISIFTEMLNPSKVTADLLKIADFCRAEMEK